MPVVTTNVGSVPDVVLDGVTGLVTSIDIQETAYALGVKRLVHYHERLYKNLLSSPAKS